MSNFLDTLMIGVLLTTLMLIGSSRFVFCIRLLAAQGIALSLLPLITPESGGKYGWLLTLITIAVKGLVLPLLLLRARREAEVSREVEPFVGFGTSLFIGMLMLGGSFWMAARLSLPSSIPTKLIVPVAFFGIFSGIFIMVSRRNALTQVLGYLILENGVFVFGVMLAAHQPLLIEMAVLLDILGGVFIMGITIFHISREFEHIDADRMSLLKDTHDSEKENP